MILNKNKLSLFGLILVGGKSVRMKTDKALLNYQGQPQWKYCYNLLTKHCEKVYISTSKNFEVNNQMLILKDMFINSFGPLTGILTAMKEYSNVAWFVLACDMPFFNLKAVANLINERNDSFDLTAFIKSDGMAEPLSTIYEPSSFIPLLNAWANGVTCPKKIIKNLRVKGIAPKDNLWLHNINNIMEKDQVKNILDNKNNNSSKVSLKRYRIIYFAAMKEQCGHSSELIYSKANTLSELYLELKQKHNFSFDKSLLRVSLNTVFVNWNTPINGGEDIFLLPPVSGG